MILKTKHFNKIEINEEDIISFNKGLPGFENHKRFVVLSKVNDDNPFKWLQSVDDGNIAFVIIEPRSFIKDYEIAIEESVVNELQIENLEEVVIYSIVTIPEKVSEMTANLKAPIIINAKNNTGYQVILDDQKYSFRWNILQEMQKTEVK